MKKTTHCAPKFASSYGKCRSVGTCVSCLVVDVAAVVLEALPWPPHGLALVRGRSGGTNPIRSAGDGDGVVAVAQTLIATNGAAVCAAQTGFDVAADDVLLPAVFVDHQTGC